MSQTLTVPPIEATQTLDLTSPTARLPLTERILRRLPGPRWAAVLAWAAVPIAGSFLPDSYIATAGREGLLTRFLTGCVFGYAVALALWAAAKFARTTAEAEASIRDDENVAEERVFRGLESTIGPLAIALVFTVATTIRTGVLADVPTALMWLPVSFISNLASCTGIWVYLVILLGLDRVGRRRLSLDLFPEDLSLGLSEVGRVAFSAFGIYVAGFLPALLPNFGDIYRFTLSLTLFMLGIVVFFLSLNRLHRQLLRARKTQVEWAREVYSRAFDTVRDGSIESLQRNASVLQAAEALEQRAETIQAWPFPDKRLRQIMAIAGTVLTFAATGVITRLVLAGVGLD